LTKSPAFVGFNTKRRIDGNMKIKLHGIGITLFIFNNAPKLTISYTRNRNFENKIATSISMHTGKMEKPRTRHRYTGVTSAQVSGHKLARVKTETNAVMSTMFGVVFTIKK